MRAEDSRIRSEDALIARIRDLTDAARSPRLLNGIGDDAAAWQPSRSHRSIITTDALVEGVHFSRDHMNLLAAGYRAMAANLSDCAASGARPVLATVALGIPSDCAEDDVRTFFGGISGCGHHFGCPVAGGDCVRSPLLWTSITIVGEVRASNYKGRRGARPGDVIAVTGELGASRAGLLAAKGEVDLEPQLRERAERAFLAPVPRLAEGRWLAASANVHALMDVSDGLSTDLARMCARSECGAVVENVPVAPCAREAARQTGEQADAFALAGGEDFELLVAVQPRAFGHVRARYRARFHQDLLPVGHFCEGSGLSVRKGGADVPLPRTGFDHFRP